MRVLSALLLMPALAFGFPSERTEDRFTGEVTVRAPNKSDFVAQGFHSGDPTLQLMSKKKEGKSAAVYTLHVMLTRTTPLMESCISMILLIDGQRVPLDKGVNVTLRQGVNYIAFVDFALERPMLARLKNAKTIEGQFCGREFSVSSDWLVSWRDIE